MKRARWSVFVLLIILLASASLSHAQTAGGGDAAIVNGESISMKDVEDAAADDLQNIEFRKKQFEQQLKRDRQSALQDALEKVIKDRLLSAEAKKRKITVDELLAIEVDGATAAPTDEAIVRFYNANKSQIQGTLADNAGNIREYLRSLNRQTIFDNLMARLSADYGVKSFVEPERTTLLLEGQPSKGPAAAPVTLVEFADFECPYCGGLFPTLQKIQEEYKEKLRVVYVEFPLSSIHPHAEKAAEAALCANEQGKFWEMHDAMFADQTNLTVSDLKKKASQLTLDTGIFDACIDGGKYLSQIKSDLSQGVEAGVSGTPAMFINGRFLQGNLPFGEIQRVIDDELHRSVSN
jgi:predicted DsbA family dithiol-disulfide isomerase